MINNSTNYQQYEQSPLTSSHRTPKKGGDHNIWRWKSRSWLGTGTHMWRG